VSPAPRAGAADPARVLADLTAHELAERFADGAATAVRPPRPPWSGSRPPTSGCTPS
jgi:hypothetical protein